MVKMTITEETTIFVGEFHTIRFRFTNFFNKEARLVYYRYSNSSTEHRGRSRKIYSDKIGRYFIHDKRKVRLKFQRESI